MKIIIYVISLMCIAITPAWALFCTPASGTNGWIEEGMTQDDVIAACGQPDQQTQDENSGKQLQTTQYWTYQKQTVQDMSEGNAVNMTISPTILVVEIRNNKITRLALNGNFVSSANCPEGGLLNVGEDDDVIVSRCGSATQVSYQNETVDSSAPPNIIWTYQSANGAAPLQIQFQNGVVSQIRE
jgi:hypothetical protein